MNGYKSVNGINMYYEIHGEGMPLVLIHGGGSTITTSFGRILPALAKNRQVIGVELAGNGHSSDREAPFTFTQDADDVAELLYQLGIKQADFLGFSNGGQTIIEIAKRHPHLLRKLIIASAFYKRDGTFPMFWDFMKNANIKDMPQLYKDTYLSITNNPAALQNMHDKSLSRMQNFKDWDDSDISSISVPTLIISGDSDVGTAEHAVKMKNLLPNGKLAIFPGGHGDYMGEILSAKKDSRVPELTATLIEEFLDE
ncbi:alpha/beta hydrolase [Inquilinus sp. KBS0705]|nr:alpha/beta hydrolase [Inquilinus sp. KBS0705]